MKNSPFNIFYILLLLEIDHQNINAFLAAASMNGLMLYYNEYNYLWIS